MSNADNDNGCKIALHDKSHFAIVDCSDELLVSDMRWYVHKGRHTNYAITFLGEGVYQLMHHRILGFTPPRGFVVDHINENGLDNRRANLQVLTHGDNIRKASKRTAGVYYLKRLKARPWRAEVKLNYQTIHIGYFATQEEAIIARTHYLVTIGKEVTTLDKR